MKLLIKALSEQGKASLQQHLIERAKMSKFNPQKIMYNKLFEEKVISENPYTLQIKIKNSMLAGVVKFKDIKSRIEDALKRNNAISTDYEIKEVNDNGM